MDGDFRIDVEEVIRKVEQAEVISMYFPMLRKTILIDTRFSDENFPLVKIMPMATSLDERHRLLNKMRPYFPRPKAITVILWPKYVDSLEFWSLVYNTREICSLWSQNSSRSMLFGTGRNV